jgi:putative intracellular protease/amidase
MKKLGLFSMPVLACLALPLLQPLSAQDQKVLLIVKEGTSADLEFMLTQEVGVMKSMLEDAGFQVVVGSPSGQPLVGEETTVTPDLELADAAMADYSGIIMPCMALESEPDLPEASRLVREAVASGKPVAAQLGSVVTLARAGVLEGRKFAYAEEWVGNVPELEGMDHEGQGVVEDGSVITSGICPMAAQTLEVEDTTPALTKALIAQLSGK